MYKVNGSKPGARQAEERLDRVTGLLNAHTNLAVSSGRCSAASVERARGGQ